MSLSLTPSSAGSRRRFVGWAVEDFQKVETTTVVSKNGGIGNDYQKQKQIRTGALLRHATRTRGRIGGLQAVLFDVTNFLRHAIKGFVLIRRVNGALVLAKNLQSKTITLVLRNIDTRQPNNLGAFKASANDCC